MSWKNTFNVLGGGVGKFWGKLKSFSTWLNLLKGIFRVAFSPIRMILISIGSVLSFLLSPIGLLVAAFVAAGVLIYRYWERVKAFFGGFWEGLKQGLAPVIEKFKPLGTVFGVVVGWIKQAVKWFMDLLSPVQSTKDELDEAASAGKKFGEWVAAGIDLALKPLKLLIDGVQWVLDNMPKLNEQNQKAKALKDETVKAAFGDGILGQTMAAMGDIPEYATGGYVGNGGKYQPMGIVHGGEYVITKEATSRLGIATLDAINYGKTMPFAPVQIDNRPALSKGNIATASSPMQISITINAQPGQDERAIARMVAQEMQRIENQRLARARSSLWDRS